MGRYYEMREYDCPADYYEAGKLGSVSPKSIRERETREAEQRAREREATYREMDEHRARYGD